MDLSKLYAAAAAAAASNANNNTTSKLIRSHHQLQQQQLQPSVSASNSRLDLESNGAPSSLASSSSGSTASIAGIDLSLAGSGRRATLPLTASSASAACAALSSFISPASLAASSASSSTTASSSLSSSTLSLVSAASNPASQHPHHPQLPSHQLIERMLQQYKASAPMTLNGPDWLSFSRPAAAYPQADSNNSSSSAAAATLELINNMMPSGKHRSSSLSDSTPTLDLRVSRQNGSSAGRKAAESYDALLTVPRPFPIQQPPLLTPPDQSACERSETMLESEMIACFTVGGEKRLCFPQILNIVLRDVSLPQINASVKELQIYCSTCTPEQMEVLKRSADIPDTAPSCGLITKTDAHRLCSALLPVQSSPVAGIDFSSISSIVVYHECFGRCVGYYAPSLYRSATSACIQCEECSGLFTPYDFVCHLHRGRENRTVHWGFDPANWRSYILPIEDYHSCNQTTTTPITVPGNSQLNPSLNNSHHNSSINCDYRLPVCSGGRKSVKSRLIGTDLERAFFDESIIRIRSTMKEMKTRFATSPAAGSASSVSSSKTSAAATTTNNNKNNHHHHHHHHHHNKRKTMENNCSPSAKDNEITTSLQAKSISTNGGDTVAKSSPALVNQDESPLSCPASKRLKQSPSSESTAQSNHLVNNGSCNTTTNTNSISSSTKATGDYLDPCDLVAPSAASHASLLSALTYPFLQSYLSSSNNNNSSNGGATIANNLSNHFANWLAGNSAAAAAATAVSDSQLVNAILKNSSLLTNGGGGSSGPGAPGGVNIEAIAAATKLLASSGNAGVGPMSSLFNGKFSDFGQSAAAQLALAAGAAANPQVFFASINANPSSNITNNNSASTGINHNNHNSTTTKSNSQMPNFQDQQLSALKSEFPMTYENLTKTSLNNESSKLSNSKSSALLHSDSGNKSGNNKNLLFERNNLEVSPPEVGGYFHKNSISTSAAVTTNGVYPHHHSHHHPNSRHANLNNANSSSQQLQHGYGPKPFSSNHFSHHTNNLVNGDTDCKDNVIINSKLINNQQNKHPNNTGYCFQSNFEQRFGLLKNCLSDSKLDSLNRHLSTIESTIDYHQQSNNHKNLKEIEQYKSKMFQSIFQMIDLFIAPTATTADQMAPSSTGANSHNHRTNHHHYKFDEDENADDEQLKMKKEWNDTAEIAKVMRLMKRKIDIDEEEQQRQKKDVQLLKRNADSRVVCNNIQAKQEVDEEDEDEEIIDVVNNSAKQTNGNEKEEEEEVEIDADQHSKHNNNNNNKSVILTQKLTKDDESEDDDDEKDIKAIAKKLTMDENGPVMITSSSSSSSNQHHTNKQSSSPTLVIVKPQNSQSNCAESSMIVSSSSLSFSSSSARSVSSPSESSLSPSPSPFSSAVASPVSSFDNSQHCSTNHRRHLSKGLSTTESTNPVSISQRSSLSRDSGSNNQNIQQSPRLLTTAAGSSPN